MRPLFALIILAATLSMTTGVPEEQDTGPPHVELLQTPLIYAFQATTTPTNETPATPTFDGLDQGLTEYVNKPNSEAIMYTSLTYNKTDDGTLPEEVVRLYEGNQIDVAPFNTFTARSRSIPRETSEAYPRR